MRWPFVLRRTHEAVLADRDEHQRAAVSFARQLRDAKRLLAARIAAAEHPSSAPGAREMAASLRLGCEARGIDLSPELARLEGADQ